MLYTLNIQCLCQLQPQQNWERLLRALACSHVSPSLSVSNYPSIHPFIHLCDVLNHATVAYFYTVSTVFELTLTLLQPIQTHE